MWRTLSFGLTTAMAMAAPATANVITLVCDSAGSSTTIDVDLARRTVFFASAPQPRTVPADISDRHVTFKSPYTGVAIRIDRKTGMSPAGWGSIGHCARASKLF